MDFAAQRLRDILVPVNGATVSLDALAFACSLTKKSKGKLYAVYVIQVQRALALDAELVPEAREAERVLVEAERIGDEMDTAVEGEILQARDAAHAIVDEAIEREVSAIVMGVAYDEPLGEFRLGETAKYVIEHAPCQVILLRAAVRE